MPFNALMRMQNDSQRKTSSLFGFQKVMDVSDRKEVKMLMDIQPYVLNQIKSLSHDKPTSKVSDLSFKKEATPNIKDYNHQIIDHENIENEGVFSIVGGYPRNILLGTEGTKTDVDIISCYSPGDTLLDLNFERVGSTSDLLSHYLIPDNTMHVIYGAYPIRKNNSNYVDHRFVDPYTFDFTINLGSICSRDGHLYAPPATIYDIENKIVRGTKQMNMHYNIHDLLDLSLIIRAFRFTLKYDMTMHNDIYIASKALFDIQSKRKSTDDVVIYHAFKHLLDDPESLRDDLYSTLKALNLFESDKYSNFTDFFNAIKERFDSGDIRENKVITNERFGY